MSDMPRKRASGRSSETRIFMGNDGGIVAGSRLRLSRLANSCCRDARSAGGGRIRIHARYAEGFKGPCFGHWRSEDHLRNSRELNPTSPHALFPSVSWDQSEGQPINPRLVVQPVYAPGEFEQIRDTFVVALGSSTP